MPKNLSNRDIIPGQTLYQYLKRKKQIALKQSVQQQQQRQKIIEPNLNQIETKRYSIPIETCRSFQIYTKRHQNEENKQNQSIFANLTKSTQRNKKSNQISYQKQVNYCENQKSKSRSKSFIEMISPLKNKANSTTHQKEIHSCTEKNIKKGHQIYNKMEIQKCFNQLKSKMLLFQNFQKQVKIKTKTTINLISSLFSQIQNKRAIQINQDLLDKKVKKLKGNSKMFQNYLQDQKLNNNENVIQKLCKIIYQNLNYFQADANKMAQQQIQDQIKRIKNQYQCKISSLTKQNSTLVRSLQLQDKKIVKIERQYNALLNKFNNLSEKTEDFYQENQYKLSETIKKYKQETQCLKEQLKDANQHMKQLNSQVTHLKYKNQQQIKKLQDLHKKKWFQKELLYIKQIQTLKSEYQKEMSKFDDFNFYKQENHHKNIITLQKQLEKITQQKKKLELQLNLKKQQLQSIISNTKLFRQKNQNLLTDLYRMNQQLYQHWLALKDIKILLKRLNLFDKFSIIYQDLKFNEILFA